MKGAMTDPSRNAWQGSRIAQWAVRQWARCRMVTADRYAWIRRRPAWQAATQTWRTIPLRSGGTLLVTAVLVNGICLWMLGRRPDFFGVLQRLLLLALGLLAAVSRSRDWNAIKWGSWLLRPTEAHDAMQ